MTDRWTAETEELVARAINDARHDYADAADLVLTALADAGLLMPPGGETREEWRVMYCDGRNREVDWSGLKFSREGADISFRLALGLHPSARMQSRSVVEYRDGSHRIGPWVRVNDGGGA
jgi:hypothetical protein